MRKSEKDPTRRVVEAVIGTVVQERSVDPAYLSLTEQTLAATLAEMWIEDKRVGIQKIKEVFEEILSLNVRDGSVNANVARLKAEVAEKMFDTYELYLAGRVRDKRLFADKSAVQVGQIGQAEVVSSSAQEELSNLPIATQEVLKEMRSGVSTDTQEDAFVRNDGNT